MQWQDSGIGRNIFAQQTNEILPLTYLRDNFIPESCMMDS